MLIKEVCLRCTSNTPVQKLLGLNIIFYQSFSFLSFFVQFGFYFLFFFLIWFLFR